MNNKRWDALWINCTCASMETGGQPFGLMTESAIAIQDGKIAWIGRMDDLPVAPSLAAIEVHDAEGRVVTPGLIDCHTHIVYAGNRCHEFALRQAGATYEEIAKAGGGIRSTVQAVRAATEDELFKQSSPRVRALVAEGVTTLEIKSGYGLNLTSELSLLRVAKRLEKAFPITVKKTFLGAHTLPLEYAGRADAYIDLICDEMLPNVVSEKLADAVDVFCETIGFTLDQTERVFRAAKSLGLAVKCHAEQLSNSGASALAARYGALSVDHLEFLSEDGVRAVATAGVTAVLLPGAYYFLRETRKPPIDLLRQYDVPMAIATDCNPGTSPVTSLLLMMNMAVTLFQLTPEEALAGVTRHAAKALGLAQTVGTLTVGKDADFVVWNVSSPVELAYCLGFNPCYQVIKRGSLNSPA